MLSNTILALNKWPKIYKIAPNLITLLNAVT